MMVVEDFVEGVRVRNKSIKMKLMFMYIPVGLLPLLMISIIYISMYEQSFTEKSQ